MGKMIISLDGAWRMRQAEAGKWMEASVPGSVYSTLLAAGQIPNPYTGENQYEVCELSRQDFVFEREFSVPGNLLKQERVLLRFEGLDTLADITLNSFPLGKADNMHRIWEYEVRDLLREGENRLHIRFSSPTRYIEERQAERALWGVDTTIPGYNYLRKAHYMFGWDWGPQLPDMGIWRSVSLLGFSTARLDGIYTAQLHEEGRVTLHVRVDVERLGQDAVSVRILLRSPHGEETALLLPVEGGIAAGEITVDAPALWWPNGYGEHPLYTLETTLYRAGEELDRRTQKIGLRTVGINREKDQWGEEFCFVINGVKLFAMGADYIPEDQIIARCTPEKTRKLLEQCVEANFNHVRVWGGGYYPEDWFYDACDELGLLVWQDFMFACAVYRMTEEFTENIRNELRDNIKRIRHHACLALWCGNNEMETAWDCWGIPQEADLKADYLFQFEELLPALCEEYDPNTFYWPSSPSCGGGFDEPNSYDRGDVHYWDVWHGMKPLTEFRKFHFRFCSEYGFMSLPNRKTVEDFADPADLNLFSAVMEAHQKCDDGMKKLLYYLSQMVRYPYSFNGVIYATQLLQADAIRSNVEHMRRNRGRCMGSTYWQVNDSNPIISWSSIDYHGRWKALHYYARRFYAPVLLSVNEEKPAAVSLNVSNETFRAVRGTIRWALRDSSARVLRQGECPVDVKALSASDCLALDLSGMLSGKTELRGRYLEYALLSDGEVISSGSSLFVKPKHFAFEDPAIRAEVTWTEDAFQIELTASAYAKSVCLDLAEADCCFSDNWFDIHGAAPVRITVPKKTLSAPLSLEQFQHQLNIVSVFDYQ